MLITLITIIRNIIRIKIDNKIKQNMYCKCKPNTIIPPARVALGYNTCVDCSTTKKVSYVPIILTNKYLKYKLYHKRYLLQYTKHGDESKYIRKSILSYTDMWRVFLLWRILYVLQNRSANMERRYIKS